jgi:nicotinamide riboside kinase
LEQTTNNISKFSTIVFIGAESTGKSTLCKDFAAHLKLNCLDEQARSYLESSKRKYTYNDVLEIAKIQHQAQTEFLKIPHQYNLLDTDLLTIKIWLDDKFDDSPNWIEDEIIKSSKKTLYVLCLPDFKWQYDPLREDENRRNEITNLYKDALVKYKLDYIEVGGTNQIRMNQLFKYLNE